MADIFFFFFQLVEIERYHSDFIPLLWSSGHFVVWTAVENGDL